MAEQGLVVVKDSFLMKLTNTLRRFFYKGKMKDLVNENKNTSQNDGIELITSKEEFVQQEIVDARRAFRKYVINNKRNISKQILLYTIAKLEENKKRIKQIIEINGDDISYQDIIEIIESEMKNCNKFKTKNAKNGCYNVPVGVIGIECSNAKDAIKSIFKSISTRNAIIILHNNFSKYSTEALVLLIVKECLKNFYIDDDIIQMLEKQEIDVSKLDKVIYKDGKNVDKCKSEIIYIYQESDKYNEEVKDEIQRLQSTDAYKSFQIKPIKGDFGNVINFLNANEASAVCMYTNNSQRAYKFINWIDSPNVFVNTGIKKIKLDDNIDNKFYSCKNILHKDVF